jgi:hypothetical protein
MVGLELPIYTTLLSFQLLLTGPFTATFPNHTNARLQDPISAIRDAANIAKN